MTSGKPARRGGRWRAAIVLVIATVAIPGCTGCDSKVPEREQIASPQQPPDSPAPPNDKLSERERSLERGIGYLLAAQGSDGGWHSDTYGQLRGGAATTALVLYALGHLDDSWCKQHADIAQRGFAFLTTGIRSKGFVANPDGSADYPTYATAMTLVAVDRFTGALSPDQRRQLVDYLIQSQLTEAQGWKPDDPDYGGWDFVGYLPGSQRTTTGTNLSVTCFVLEALSTARPYIDLGVIKRAKLCIVRCQSRDGGFVFSPRAGDPANKAQWSDEQQLVARSYGSMTCDGVRTLKFCGEDRRSESLAAGVGWIAKRHTLDVVPGFEDLPAEVGWQEGLRYYYYASLAAALDQLDPAVANRLATDLSAKLIALQAADGSWQNESARMREDDPLIATAFAVIALTRIRQ